MELIARKIDAVIRKAQEEFVVLEAERILGEAQRRAPIKEGFLRQSGEPAGGEFRPRRILQQVVAEIVFSAPYAAAQHEGFFEHPLGGERKFLEGPLNEAIPGMPGRLQRHIRRSLRTAGLLAVSRTGRPR